jgi:pyrimidine deaminase RibD-like protein
MREPIFRPENMAARPSVSDIGLEAGLRARDRALLWRATTLAIEGAFRFGQDFPVGAVAARGDEIIGRYFSSDNRLGYANMHAEYMAVADTLVDPINPAPDTVVVSLEPCGICQDFLARQPSIKRVGFGLTRQQVAEKGLVKPHSETIFARAARLGLPYKVIHIEDSQLQTAGTVILDCVSRDIGSGVVNIDTEALSKALTTLNES